MKWREVAIDPKFNLECYLDSQEKRIEHLQKLIDNATNYYLKELRQSVYIDEVAVEMFNILEGNKQ